MISFQIQIIYILFFIFLSQCALTFFTIILCWKILLDIVKINNEVINKYADILILKLYYELSQQKIMHANHEIKSIIVNQECLQNTPIQISKPPHSKTLIFMFFYLYIIQGIVVSFGATMPYIYSQLPSYKVMSLFASVALPFSFKFLIAPITQKINFTLYGKRKTWIVISQLSTAICLFIASSYTSFQTAGLLAIILITSMFFISLQDISLDCLALKQLKTPHLVSMVSTVANIFGTVFGSLVLLKLTSKQFALRVGFQNQITQASIIFRIFSLLLLVTALVFHLFFKQTVLQMQKQLQKKSFWDVLCYYRVFINPKTKYFRLVIFFLVYYQGFNFFNAGYDYQLIKAGFSRDANNTINNIIIIPISMIACLLSSQIQKFGLVNSTFCSQILILFVRIYLLIYFPLQIQIIFIVSFLTQFAYTWQSIINSIMINVLPIFGVSGMLLTVLAGSCNFGQQKGIHTVFISICGWKTCAIIGMIIQTVIVLMMPKFYKWIDEGIINIEQNQNIQQKGIQIRSDQLQTEQTFKQTESNICSFQQIIQQNQNIKIIIQTKPSEIQKYLSNLIINPEKIHVQNTQIRT